MKHIFLNIFSIYREWNFKLFIIGISIVKKIYKINFYAIEIQKEKCFSAI